MTPIADRYPLPGLLADYGRALGGFGVCLALLLSVDGAPVIVAVLGALTACFAAFAARTAVRHLTTVHADDTGIRLEGPMPATLAWTDLRTVRLRYFSPRPGGGRTRLWKEMEEMPRPRTSWLQLDLKGPGGTVRIDSNLPGFHTVLERAAERIRDGDVAVNDVTRANLAALGLMTWTEAVDPAAPPAPTDERLP